MTNTAYVSRISRVERALDGLKPQPKEGTLLDRKRTQLNGLLAAAELLTAQIVKVTAQIDTLEKFPVEDPYVDGTQIKFTRNFPGSEHEYTYAALRANGVWYTTGKVGVNGVPWAGLINWLGLGLVGEIEVVHDPLQASKVKSPARKRASRTRSSNELLG
jgi:hypothetical protein